MLQYSQLSLSPGQRDPLMKHIEISLLRYIRFAELREIQIKQPNFTNTCKYMYVIWLLKFEIIILKILWKRGEIAPKEQSIVDKRRKEQFLLLSTILWYLQVLNFYVKRRTRFSFQDELLFKIIEAEITRVDCICGCQLFQFDIEATLSHFKPTKSTSEWASAFGKLIITIKTIHCRIDQLNRYPSL